MITVTPYTSEKKSIWNQLILNGKNGHFLFHRDYMEYHADRFHDASLLFYDQETLLAALPATKIEDQCISHGGLTFGGLVIDKKVKMSQVLDVFSALIHYLQSQDFKKLRYKAVPHIYHEVPAEEDLYGLFRNQAKLIRRDVSSTIDLHNKIGFSGGKKNGIAKAKKNGIMVCESKNFAKFYTMMNVILSEKYQTKATHTAEEMTLLAGRFPENIKLYSAFLNHEMVAGVIVYLSKMVVHTQYMATTEEGREIGALDFLLHTLINDIYSSSPQCYFDFGISTEQQGQYLNQGLIFQKEMFGARAIMYDTYEISLSS